MNEDTPRLRPLEASPVEHEGQRLVALRDPAGYTTSILLLPLPLLEVLALLDGQRSILDIQAELARRHGEIVPRADIEDVIAALDEHGFMESARFAARRAAIDRAFVAAAVRPAAHAGSAYPVDPGELRRAMDAFFTTSGGPGAIDRTAARADGLRAVIAPHIDYHRGGPGYAWAYRDLAERSDADLFVIFGTCHAGMPDPFALTRKDYDTPFGPAPVDRDFVERLAARAGQDCFASEAAHRVEHSIEFQAVFLRYLSAGRRDIAIVPVLASFAHEALAGRRRVEDDPRIPRFLEALGETIAASGRRVALIAGADLAHVGPRFDDPEPVSPSELDRIEREDRAMLGAVQSGDAAAFFESVARDNDRRRICGLSPIYALLRALGSGAGSLRHYGQWPDPQGVVSYASVVF
ncbi:MAG: AmmeMemoRadiSam system protein B [Candidatus Rokubacteria bacterium 13_1_40CM_4_69_5]|nr:MAG: AmmeMemoRadiSam system protein B [Candidatus Rokubacteria bacterium 13_1_40CM_4_69_5]